MKYTTKTPAALRTRLLNLGLALTTSIAGIATLIAGCMSTPQPHQPAPPLAKPVLPATLAPVAVTTTEEPTLLSKANTPREYRVDAATHLYGKNQNRIYQGKMPPLLYAIGVLQVDVDARGLVTRTNWMRAPTQAPEVVAEIERTVRAAAPYPAPIRLGRVTYTDTWLWHKSGTFQLDTLTEGQM